MSSLIILFTSTVYYELIEIGKYRYINKIDKEITSEIMNSIILANEGNITVYKKKKLGCEIEFKNNSFVIIFQNNTYIHKFNNIQFLPNKLSEISKISCRKINDRYIIEVK
ncbi:hypothetical protein [Methanocaldococcus lauensis]|uniref:hypothetical protein n=1 Tax=Methanocaldococcus lauensis TaxID=2546128 RepID=UPI0020289360|nr:hypothetical protein [Methanocaldococcus lauensis]